MIVAIWLTFWVALASSVQAWAGQFLDRTPPESLSIAAQSRDSIPERVPVSGPWRLVGTADGVRTWEAPLPVRPRTLFFHKPVDDLAVFRESADGQSRRLKHGTALEDWSEPHTWSFTAGALRVRRPLAAGRPAPSDYSVRYTRATERETGLNQVLSGLDLESFSLRSVQLDDTTRRGLLLPAPSRARWTIDVPVGAVLDFEAALLPPEAADPEQRSDGCGVEVWVDGVRLLSEPLTLRAFQAHRVDLGAYEGRSVSIELRTEPGETGFLDYAFIAEPMIHTPDSSPPRVVLVFVDTLRADHVSAYGYERETSPGLDAWFGQGAIFEQARTISPWTLPSTRTMLTGTLPESWGQTASLPARFSEAGWATAFLAGNVYLSSNFEMADDWGTHRVINWPNADVQVDRALSYLEAHRDRPVFMVLHLMDMHLPYTEPLSYRNRFAGEAPAGLERYSFQRSQVIRAVRKMGDAGKQYVVDRYDNNLAFVDDELMRFFASLSEQDTVMLVSDHGEEFWEHGGFEHGHTLYDELLRIPLMWRGPGATEGRFAAPVSMLDVAPTLAQAANLPTDGMVGWPLQSLVDESRTADFEERPQAFGRPLYGMRRWGVLVDGMKFSTTLGADARFDLAADPGEENDLFVSGEDVAPYLTAMGAALQVEVVNALRLMPSKSRDELVLDLTVAGGIRTAFSAQDPQMRSAATVTVDGDRVRVVWSAGQKSMREVYVVPALPVEEAALGLSGQIVTEAGIRDFLPDIATPAPVDGKTRTVARIRGDGRTVGVGYAKVPVFPDDATQLEGFDSESKGALQVLGYVDEDSDSDEGEAVQSE